MIAVAVGVVDICGTFLASHHHATATRSWDFGALALLAVGPVALVFRRRWPAYVLGITFASILAYDLIGYPNGPY